MRHILFIPMILLGKYALSAPDPNADFVWLQSWGLICYLGISWQIAGLRDRIEKLKKPD